MRCDKILEILETKYPQQAALDFDNVGLLVGRIGKEVEKIYIAVDATDEIIEEAVRFQADLLITHHPLIFTPMKRVTDQDFIGRRMMKLIQNDISYYAMHTNYDVLGMAELSAGLLGLREPEVLEVTRDAEAPELPQGIGRVGSLSVPMTLRECCDLVKERFCLDKVRVFGDLQQKVTRAAICPGSGKSVIGEAIRKGAQVLIAGDIGHHEGIDAVAQGLAIIDAGHYGTEYIFMKDIREYLERRLPEIQMKTAETAHPFQTV